jgi:hypothetical protein
VNLAGTYGALSFARQISQRSAGQIPVSAVLNYSADKLQAHAGMDTTATGS